MSDWTARKTPGVDVEELARFRRQVDQAVDGFRAKHWNTGPQLRIDFSRREEPDDWGSWIESLRETNARGEVA